MPTRRYAGHCHWHVARMQPLDELTGPQVGGFHPRDSDRHIDARLSEPDWENLEPPTRRGPHCPWGGSSAGAPPSQLELRVEFSCAVSGD